MVRTLLMRGMLAGLLAGVLAFGFARVFGEPPVDRAIAFEEQNASHAGHAAQPGAEAPAEVELVSRTTQAGIGLGTALIVYGAAIGGLFSLVFAYVYGRVGRLSARTTSALLALGAFIAVVLVPLMKYPANPPAVGSPDTIGPRTGLFLMMLIISLVAATVAVLVARRLWLQLGGWNASVIAGFLFVSTIGIAQYFLPVVDEVPEHFSASVLWQFRVAVLGVQFVLWTTIGLAFGALAERSLSGRLG